MLAVGGYRACTDVQAGANLSGPLRPTVQLASAAGDIDDAGRGRVLHQRQQRLRHAERAEEIGFQSVAQRLRLDRGSELSPSSRTPELLASTSSRP